MLPADHPDIAMELLRRMKRIRCAEETIAQRYAEGKMRCPTHLSTGQEAVPAAAGLVLRTDDQVVSTHRSHAHYIGKGGNINAMIAELYGKAAGCSSGRGGSMHLIDLSVGFLGSAAIVGNSMPIGVGAALSNRLLANGLISCVFLGDATPEEGVFLESLNFAALKKLPVLFLCENNLYSVYTHLRERQPEGREIWKLAAACGVNSDCRDGNDAWSAFARIHDAAEYVRKGSGPFFIEFRTYRWREHCGPAYDNDLGYRPVSEFEEWKARDPVLKLQRQLTEAGLLDAAGVKAMEKSIEEEVTAAFRFAEESPAPAPEDAFSGLFAE